MRLDSAYYPSGTTGNMRKKTLGQSQLSVSVLCFGGNVFGWTADEATSFRLLDAFTAAGGNFIDTADVYSRWISGNSGGESETIIGKWMKQRNNRDKVIIATKVGMEMGPDRKGLSKKYILRSVEDSLRRLQTDYIDLYISHTPDPSTPIEETTEAYAQLIEQGKVRACGASNYSGEELRQALETSRKLNLPAYQSLQPEYNMYDREQFETTLQPVCEEFKLGVTPYYSLASGFLTGKYRSTIDFAKSPRGGRMSKYLNERGLRILDALDKVAAEYSVKPASVALAWLMSRPVITAAIASATSIEQLNDLIRATQIDLSQEAQDLLTQASAY